MHLTIENLVQQLLLQYPDPESVIFIGIQQGGVVMGDEIIKKLNQKFPLKTIRYGQLDITFYRDDIRKQILAPDTMNLPFSIENHNIVLIDDVLFTGRTIKAALDVLLDYGRPAKVQLCVLVDRKEHRQFPIQADFVGMSLPTNKTDKVKLVNNKAGDKEVILMTGQ